MLSILDPPHTRAYMNINYISTFLEVHFMKREILNCHTR